MSVIFISPSAVIHQWDCHSRRLGWPEDVSNLLKWLHRTTWLNFRIAVTLNPAHAANTTARMPLLVRLYLTEWKKIGQGKKAFYSMVVRRARCTLGTAVPFGGPWRRAKGRGPLLLWFTAHLSFLQTRWQGNRHFLSGLVFVQNIILAEAVISATSVFFKHFLKLSFWLFVWLYACLFSFKGCPKTVAPFLSP